MLKLILLAIPALLAVFLIIAAFQPTDFRISRSGVIAAPPQLVFEQVNDFHKWNDWSPWAKMDPNAKNTFEGSQSGVGAGFAWAGNSQVGEGNMKITESRPSDLILIRLEFIKPFAAVNTTEFTFKPEGDKTAVTWTMTGKNSFIGKVMVLIMNCDKMVGGQFEKGLENLNAVVATKRMAEPTAKL